MPNIGHLDIAAGVASIIKTALALKNRTLPPTIHFAEANPELHLEKSPFFINDRLREWNTDGKSRIAGVSSFGIGGTNCHAVLQEAPAVDVSPSSHPYELLLISAKTADARDRATKNLSEHFAQNPSVELADAAYTLMMGRKEFPFRRYVVCRDTETAVENLNTPDAGWVQSGRPSGDRRDVVFMFSGQGSQYLGMAGELYEYLPVFRRNFDYCADVLQPLLGKDIRDLVYFHAALSNSPLDETYVTQPVLFAVEYAYAAFLTSCGIRPTAMIGHSIGEYVAACISGVFTLEEALELVAIRGRSIQEQEKGTMLAIQLPEEEILPLLPKTLSIAAVNSPRQCVVSGPETAIEDFEKIVKERSATRNQKISCIRLRTSHAFHSSMMNPASAELAAAVERIGPNPPGIPFVSNVTGRFVTAEQATDPQYWAAHLTSAVQFSKGIETLLQTFSNPLMIEIGPGNTLSSLARQHDNASNNAAILSTIRHRDHSASDFAFMLNTLGRIWLEGIPIDWVAYRGDEKRARIPLPAYPFERKRYWIDFTPNTNGDRGKTVMVADDSGLSDKATGGDGFRESLDSVEAKLMMIWKRILGACAITKHDDFFELGGHSLLAAQLFAEIERVFGKVIPTSILYSAPTVAKLADMLREGAVVEWTNIVPIRQGGTKPPLFLVHGAEGNVLLYRSLAEKLGDEQPVYGLQADGLDGSYEIDADFKTVARKYLEQIKEVQPTGPYHLGGYCLGGVIALEIAQQLHRSGEKVNFLGMIEIYNIQTLDWPLPIPIRIYNKFLNACYHILNTVSPANENKWSFIKEKAGVEWGRLKINSAILLQQALRTTGLKKKEKYHHLRVDKSFDQALAEYYPEKYQGRITIFVPNRLPAGFTDPQTYGFGEIAAGGLARHEIPAYPRGTLVEPYVRILAEKMKISLDDADQNQSKGQAKA